MFPTLAYSKLIAVLLAVLGADGILGLVAQLDWFDRVVAYPDRLILRKEAKPRAIGADASISEMSCPEENNLYYGQAYDHGWTQSDE